jgi:hypothetical protein
MNVSNLQLFVFPANAPGPLLDFGSDCQQIWLQNPGKYQTSAMSAFASET